MKKDIGIEVISQPQPPRKQNVKGPLTRATTLMSQYATGIHWIYSPPPKCTNWDFLDFIRAILQCKSYTCAKGFVEFSYLRYCLNLDNGFAETVKQLFSFALFSTATFPNSVRWITTKTLQCFFFFFLQIALARRTVRCYISVRWISWMPNYTVLLHGNMAYLGSATVV